VREVELVPLPDADRKLLADFQKDLLKIQRDLSAVLGTASQISSNLDQMKVVLDQLPEAPPESRERVRKLIASQKETVRKLNGDSILRARNENVPMSISERVGIAVGAGRTISAKPTGTQREQFAIARQELDEVSATLRQRSEKDLRELETLLDKLGAPWTPGRLPPAK